MIRRTDRWILAATVVLVDLVVFVVPITGLAAAYLIVVRPPWFRRWLNDLYSSP